MYVLELHFVAVKIVVNGLSYGKVVRVSDVRLSKDFQVVFMCC